MERDEVESIKWDAWDRALVSVAGVIAVGGRKDGDALTRLYDVAMELRERLRRSQGRLRGVKQELSATISAARSERHESMARLQELEAEVARLAGAVQAQGSTLAAREALSNSQTAENEQLRRHVAGLERQLQRCEEDRRAAFMERDDALRHLDRMSRLLEEAESRVAEVEEEQNTLLGELVATKDRLADLSTLETLYGAARDELQRLDKENLELKDIVAAGGVQLGRSRILEALGIQDSAMEEAAEAALGRGGGRTRSKTPRRRRRSGSGHRSSSPLLLLGYGGGGGGGGGGGSGTGGGAGGGFDGFPGRSRSAPRVRRGSSLPTGSSMSGSPRCPTGPLQLSSRSYTHSLHSYAPTSPHSTHSQSHTHSLEDPVSEMAFLGAPSSAYPPDPENYIFYRVGGGFEARVNPARPTVSQPRASGWVPKDVVRLVQAFRHSYGLSLEWRYWEPLVLMIDEVYRSRADGTLAAMRAAQREKLKVIKRQVRAALGYPSVVATGKINHLQRQLNSARKVLAQSDRKGEQSLRQMVVKDYHLGYQLDRAVEENYALRRSLEDLEQLYNKALNAGGGADGGGGGGVPGGLGGLERRRSLASAGAAAVATPPPPPPAGPDPVLPSSPSGVRRSVTSELYASALASPQRTPSSTAMHLHPGSPKEPLSRSGSDRFGGGDGSCVRSGSGGSGLSPRPSSHHISHPSPFPSPSPHPSAAPSPHPQAHPLPPHRLSQSQLNQQQMLQQHQQQYLKLQQYQQQQHRDDDMMMPYSRRSTTQQQQQQQPLQQHFSEPAPPGRSASLGRSPSVSRTGPSDSHRQSQHSHAHSHAHSHTHTQSQSSSRSEMHEPLRAPLGTFSRCTSMGSMARAPLDSAIDRASLRSLP